MSEAKMSGDGSSVSFDFTQFRKKLLRWYAKHARQLPWRETEDPYAIWVSEIMLQQTQVKTVLSYYARFLDQLPTVQALAAADEQTVLSLWAGLGYYRRARQLHAAAKVIVEKHAGSFPTDIDDVRGLPGVGRYTAGAITSFAYNQANPIVEANTARLYARLIGLREPTPSRAGQDALWKFAEAILPKRAGARDLNQALIELGSQVCFPDKPNCSACPVAQFCAAYRLGTQASIPAAIPKPVITPVVHAMLIVRDGEKVLLRQCQPGEWWQGLWEFPRVELAGRVKLPTDRSVATRKICQTFLAQHDIEVELDAMVAKFTHAVTRYRIQLHCFKASFCHKIRPSDLVASWSWVDQGDLPPLSAPSKKLLKLLRTIPD